MFPLYLKCMISNIRLFSPMTTFLYFSGFCPDLREISNGQVIETRPNIGRAAVEFRCIGKFRLVGRSRLECIDGRWNGKLPFCESKLSLQSIAFIKILTAKVSNLVGDKCYLAVGFNRNKDSSTFQQLYFDGSIIPHFNRYRYYNDE